MLLVFHGFNQYNRDSVLDNIFVLVKHLNSRYNNKMYLHLTFHVYKEPYS